MNEKEMLQKIKKIRDEFKEISEDNYWAYTKEYYKGLIDSCVFSLDRILYELGDINDKNE